MTARLSVCAAALTGTAAALPSADAAIVTFNTPIPVPNTFAGIYFNLGTGATGLTQNAVPGWDFNPYAANNGNLQFFWNGLSGAGAGGVANSTNYISLAPGATVGPGSNFSATPTATNGSPYLTTGTFILGFQFFNDATGATNYGYLRMSTTASTGFPATVQGWSYDNTGAPITVAVPEPAATALLGAAALVLGAFGVRQWRRQTAE